MPAPDKFTFVAEDREAQDATVLRLNGPIDAFSYLGLKAVLARWMKGDLEVPVRRHLAIDFGGVSYAASSGWSVIFMQSALMQEEGRGMVLFNLAERAAHSLRLLEQRQSLVRVEGDEASALKALGPQPAGPVA
jgi:anti-anti-sigma factor